MQAFCAICQDDTEHAHRLDHNGEHVIECQSPRTLVKACTACVAGDEHRTNDAGETVHGNEEYRHGHVDQAHHVSDPYDGTCKAFVKLPASFTMDDVTAYLEEHKGVNDRRGLPEPPCVHLFSTVAPRVGDSVCDRCGKSHSELFS